MEKEKVVVLNSGGFDSIVLIHHVYTVRKGAEIHSLHFNYGSLNEEQQKKCVDKVCEKLGAVNKTIDLPKFDWTKSNFYNQGYDYTSQYLEYRNLVFIAYALSYAESIGAKEIFLAIVDINYENPDYTVYADANYTFINGINSFSIANSDIAIVTPFIDMTKDILFYFAYPYGINKGDFFSCDVPKNGEPCGECPDCEDLKPYLKILDKKCFKPLEL